MLKISLTILTIYLLYYAGNIVYDLFLKQDKKKNEEETEEFSFSGILDVQKDISIVGIEDVENLNTPKSFNKNPIQNSINETNEERLDLERLRELFEAEQDLDGEGFPKENSNETVTEAQSYSEAEKELTTELEQETTAEIEPQKTFVEQDNLQTHKTDQPDQNLATQENPKSIDWKTMLNLSETLVQLVANHDGHKVYHSVM